jgi:hypothetical protein
MHFITKILNDLVDDSVHRAFLRYGRGEYPGPAAEVTVTKAGRVKVRSTYMYQDLPAAVMLSVVPVEMVSLSGIVLSYEPLDDALTELGFKVAPSQKKPRTLLYQSKLAGEYPVKQVAQLYSTINEIVYIFCSLNAGLGWVHKPKAKIPSAQKEPPLNERLKFSTTQVSEKTEFVQELLPELIPDFLGEISTDFSSMLVENTYEIQDLIFPPDMNQLSSKEVRFKTKRRGILHRKLLVDGSEFIKEHSMVV